MAFAHVLTQPFIGPAESGFKRRNVLQSILVALALSSDREQGENLVACTPPSLKLKETTTAVHFIVCESE